VPSVRERLAKAGQDLLPMTTEQFENTLATMSGTPPR